MKQSVQTIIDSIEKEINTIMDNAENSVYNGEIEFQYGKFTYELFCDMVFDALRDPWDADEINKDLEVKSVTVTNENSKVLTNLSTEVFNQLETTYTNY